MRPKRKDKKVASPQKNVGNREKGLKTAKIGKIRSGAANDVEKSPDFTKKKNKSKKSRVPTRFAFSKPKIELEIDGFGQSRILSELAANGIKAEKVRKITARVMRIIIEEKYAANCFAICRRMCYNYTEVERFGVKYVGLAAVRRSGAIIAAVAVVAVGCSFSAKLNKIEIVGTDEARVAAITAYLADNGIKPHCKTSSVSAAGVRELVLGYDGVAECTASLTGNRLTVTVRDKDVPAEKPERKSEIVSRYDAVVTRVVALGGTAKVEPGQTVKVGQTLIEGAVYRTDGELLGKTDAIGTVYGKVTTAKKFVVTENAFDVRRTGKKIRSTELSFFGVRIGGKTPEGTFEKTVSSPKTIGFITVASALYEEVERTAVTFTRDDLVEKCISAASEEYFGSGETTTKTHVAELGGGVYEITVYTENERIIT